MEGILIGLVVGVILTVIIYSLAQKKIIKIPDEENLSLKFQVKELTEQVGGLQAHLGSKEKELQDRNRRLEEFEDKLENEKQNNKKILSQKKSSEIRTGHIAEHLAPYMMEKYDPKNMKFLGQPIDYLIFENDGIYFVEVKSGKSHLSYNQKKIKKLVLDKKVYWDEFRIKGIGKRKTKRSKK